MPCVFLPRSHLHAIALRLLGGWSRASMISLRLVLLLGVVRAFSLVRVKNLPWSVPVTVCEDALRSACASSGLALRRVEVAVPREPTRARDAAKLHAGSALMQRPTTVSIYNSFGV